MLIKKKKKQRLTLELIGMTLVSLLIAFLAGNLAGNLGYEIVLNKLERDQYFEEQVEESLDSLQQFIQENHVTEANIELLVAWVQREPNVYTMLYRDVDALFGSNMLWMENVEENKRRETFNQTTYHNLTLADGTLIKAEMDCYLEAGYFYVIDLASFVFGGIIFVLVLFGLIHRKIRYIHCLEQELKILGSGNLEYPMTIRGNDELTRLAEGIEALKNGILEEQLQKEEAEKANAELVTAMSHDLRTPLTSLIGYLELLNMHRYQNEEQLQNYLEHCREKAFQMKKMSDRLFEYFLVYGKREHHYQFRVISCEDLVEEFCNGQFFDWMDQGGTMECKIEELKGSVRIDSEYLQRVLDNIVSNLKKYGNIEKPLRVHAFERQDMLHILLTNYVREQKNRIESTQIGLRTCRRILEAHGGTFEWRSEGETFIMDGRLPLYHEGHQ